MRYLPLIAALAVVAFNFPASAQNRSGNTYNPNATISPGSSGMGQYDPSPDSPSVSGMGRYDSSEDSPSVNNSRGPYKSESTITGTPERSSPRAPRPSHANEE